MKLNNKNKIIHKPLKWKEWDGIESKSQTNIPISASPTEPCYRLAHDGAKVIALFESSGETWTKNSLFCATTEQECLDEANRLKLIMENANGILQRLRLRFDAEPADVGFDYRGNNKDRRQINGDSRRLFFQSGRSNSIYPSFT